MGPRDMQHVHIHCEAVLCLECMFDTYYRYSLVKILLFWLHICHSELVDKNWSRRGSKLSQPYSPKLAGCLWRGESCHPSLRYAGICKGYLLMTKAFLFLRGVRHSLKYFLHELNSLTHNYELNHVLMGPIIESIARPTWQSKTIQTCNGIYWD